MKSLRVFLTAALAVFLLHSCHKADHSASSSSSIFESNVNWNDSAYKLAKKAEYYYNNNLRDSLYQQVELDKEFYIEHELWTWYYYAWMMKTNKLTFSSDLKKAMEEAMLMHTDAAKRSNNYGLAVSNYCMGLIYAIQDNYEEAAPCFEQALHFYPNDVEKSVMYSIYSYYSTVLEDKHDPVAMESMLKRWKSFLDNNTNANDEVNAKSRALWLNKYYRARFNYHFSTKNLSLAAEDLDSIQYYINISGNNALSLANLEGARVQLMHALGNYSRALEMSNREMNRNKDLDAGLYMMAVSRRSDILEGLGLYKDALSYYKEYTALKDSISKANTRMQLNELNKRFEVDELKAEKVRADIEHQRTQLFYIAIIALLLLIALAVHLHQFRRSEKKLEAEHRRLLEAYAQLASKKDALAVANARAMESSKMKTDFIHQISHEIRTPLNILSGFTQVLTTSGIDLDEKAKEEIKKNITDNTNRITDVVNKMLDLSDASSSTVIERNDVATPEQLVSLAVEESKITSAQHLFFELNIDASVKELQIHTNEKQATRLLTLLLDNACKFTKPSHNPLSHRNNPQEVRLFVKPTDNHQLEFIVEDTGIGIKPDEAEHIFEEFVQLDEYYEGTGIGLTVARSLARRMGGDIKLDTQYTQGARFIATLPIEKEETQIEKEETQAEK